MALLDAIVGAQKKRKKVGSSYYDPLANEQTSNPGTTSYAGVDPTQASIGAAISPTPTSPAPLSFNPTADAGVDKSLPFANANEGLSQALLRSYGITTALAGGDVYGTNVGQPDQPAGVTYTGNTEQARPGHPEVQTNVLSAGNDPLDISNQINSHLSSVLGESVARNATKRKTPNLGFQDLTDPNVRARLIASGYALPGY